MQQCACNPGNVCKGIFLCPLPCLPHSFPYPIFSNFFFFTLKTQKAIGCMSGLLFTRNIYSRLMIIFASFKNCPLLTLWPISCLTEIMPSPYYLYRKVNITYRQSALSIIRVANRDVCGCGQGNGNPFFVTIVLNKKP